MKSRIAVLAVLLLSSAAVFASGGVDGGWKGTIRTGDEASDIMMSLTTDGTQVTGSIYSKLGETNIQDGVVDGSTIRFTTVQRDYATGAALAINCIGSVLEDSISFTCRTDEPSPRTQEFTVTRQAALNP